MENTDNVNGSSPEREYIAFISYRHLPLDTKVATLIQQRIERYTVPKEYREKTGNHPGIVFRDEDELPISPNLSESIIYALDHSQFLIVICTRALRESKWCDAEISYFIKKYGRDRVIAVLAEGTPEESFPLQLLHTYDSNGNITGDLEPLAANLAGEDGSINKKAVSKETTRIIAALLGCPFDTLWQRDKRRRTNRILAVLGAVAAVLAIFLVMMIQKNAQISAKNKEISNQNTQISAQNEEISNQNLRINAQNQELQRQLSTALVDAGQAKLDKYDVKGALQDGLDALLEGNEDSDALYDRRAEALLTEALAVYQHDVPHSSILYEQSSAISFITVSEDGNDVYLTDRAGVVNSVDLETGILYWTSTTAVPGLDPSNNDPALYVLEEQGILLCKNTANIKALSLEDGSTIWEYQYLSSGGNNFRGLSPDEKLLMIIDGEESGGDSYMLYALDSGSGQIVGQADLSGPEYEIDLNYQTDWYRCDCVFSDDGSRVVAAVFENIRDENSGDIIDYQCMYFLVDCESWEVVHSAWTHGLSRGSASLFYGMHLMPENDNLFCALYSAGVIYTTIFDWETLTSTREETFKTLRSVDGMNSSVEIYTVQRMLANENIAVVFSDNTILLFDRKDATLMRNYEMEGNILYAWWVDREEEIVGFLMDNGQVGHYDFNHGDYILDGYAVYQYNQDDILLTLPVNGGIFQDSQNGMYLTVGKNNPGLLKVRSLTDPGLQLLSLPEGTSAINVQIQATPSGNKILVFCPTTDSETLTVISYDAETGEETARTSFTTDEAYPCTVLDDSHFISGCMIYDLKTQTREYLEGLTEESPGVMYPRHYQSVRLTDGTVLTTEDLSDQYETDHGTCSCWLNGKLLPESTDPDRGIVLPCDISSITKILKKTDFKVGRNGWVLVYGTLWQEGMEESADADPMFIAFHTADGTRRLIEDPFPQDEKRDISMDSEKPVFACAYSDGRILLFDLDTGSYRILDTAYLPGEIQSYCLSDKDEYLLVMTMTARLDVYDLTSGTLVMSEVLKDIKERNEYLKSSYGIFSRLSCTVDREQNRLHVYASMFDDTDSYWTCINTDAWIVTAHTEKIYGWVPESRSLYGWERGPLFMKYPMYSLNELADLARTELEK